MLTTYKISTGVNSETGRYDVMIIDVPYGTSRRELFRRVDKISGPNLHFEWSDEIHHTEVPDRFKGHVFASEELHEFYTCFPEMKPEARCRP